MITTQPGLPWQSDNSTIRRSKLKILSWNLGHQTREKPLAAGLLDAIKQLGPDVLVLNEFVDGPTRQSLYQGLGESGFAWRLVSDRVGRHNQVLIASKSPLLPGLMRGPDMPGGAGASNFLHVQLENFELVGLRAPAYKTQGELQQYWSLLSEQVTGSAGRRMVWIGDLNADPDRPRYVGGRTLRSLEASGWQLPRPTGTWSFVKGTRIDHALVAKELCLLSARYVIEVNGRLVVSAVPGEGISDHAALEIHIQT